MRTSLKSEEGVSEGAQGGDAGEKAIDPEPKGLIGIARRVMLRAHGRADALGEGVIPAED